LVAEESGFATLKAVDMITYRAMFKYLDGCVHAEVLDFPGVISCGCDLDAARRLLRSALADMA